MIYVQNKCMHIILSVLRFNDIVQGAEETRNDFANTIKWKCLKSEILKQF